VTRRAEGFPQSRLADVVSIVSSHCRAILVRAPSEATDVRAWRGCGLNGVTLDCASFDPADRKAQHRLAAFGAQPTPPSPASAMGFPAAA